MTWPLSRLVARLQPRRCAICQRCRRGVDRLELPAAEGTVGWDLCTDCRASFAYLYGRRVGELVGRKRVQLVDLLHGEENLTVRGTVYAMLAELDGLPPPARG